MVVGHRIEQQLAAQSRTALVACPKRGDRRHVAACTVAGDSDPPYIGAKFGRMRRRPARRVQAIVDAGREFVLWRQAVVDRGNDAAAAGAQISAHAVMRIEAAQYEAAAVKEHEQWKRTRAVRRIDAKA